MTQCGGMHENDGGVDSLDAGADEPAAGHPLLERISAASKRSSAQNQGALREERMHLNAADVKILKALAASPILLHQVEIETASTVSRRTVGKRLKRLRKWGLVVMPDGKRGGHEITQAGRDALPTRNQ
jgi:DNA-binding transcriptional ArsR family regulator